MVHLVPVYLSSIHNMSNSIDESPLLWEGVVLPWSSRLGIKELTTFNSLTQIVYKVGNKFGCKHGENQMVMERHRY